MNTVIHQGRGQEDSELTSEKTFSNRDSGSTESSPGGLHKQSSIKTYTDEQDHAVSSTDSSSTVIIEAPEGNVQLSPTPRFHVHNLGSECSICSSLTNPLLRNIANSFFARQLQYRNTFVSVWATALQQISGHNGSQSRPEIDGISDIEPTWSYASKNDNVILERQRGNWLYPRPPTHFNRRRKVRHTETAEGFLPAPVKISKFHTRSSLYAVLFDGETVEIVPHMSPWPDDRSDITHPDFLPAIKLTEYQACEKAGYQIWRFDRKRLKCQLLDCDECLSDEDASATYCPGCGPLTTVRYCSFQHQMQDAERHLPECGRLKFLIKPVVDEDSTPEHFQEQCPMIQERNGVKSLALYKQQLNTIISKGHYSVFVPGYLFPVPLSWPTNGDPTIAIEMDCRIERLLNITFLDTHEHSILSYLFGLLCVLLRKSFPHSSDVIVEALSRQFAQEYGQTESNWALYDTHCECQWRGPSFLGEHEETCPWHDLPDLFRLRRGASVAEGIKSKVEKYEARYWILRAWQQQHPTESSWWGRVEGAGFGGEDLCGTTGYRLGPGFEGYGEPGSNMLE